MLDSNIVPFGIFPLSLSALGGPRHGVVQVFRDIHFTVKNMNGVPTCKLNLKVDVVIILNFSGDMY